MSELVPFDFEGRPVRVVAADGGPWLVAADACGVLSIRDTSSALKMVDPEDVKRFRRSDTPQIFEGIAPQVQEITVVNESGLYALIFHSRKPEARKFKRWVTHEVLPALRKTGRYEVGPATIELSLDDYERILDGGKQVVAELRATRLELETAQQGLDESHAYIEHLEPDAEAFRNIVKDDGRDWDVRTAARFLTRSDPRIDIGQKQLFEKLRQWELIDRWNVPYRQWGHLVTSMPKKFTDPHTGERRWAPKDQVRVTWAGLGWMRAKLLGEIEKAAAEKKAQQRDLFSQPNGDNVRALPARRDDDGGVA